MTPMRSDSHRSTARRLERALAVLIQRTADGTYPQAPTIAALCRLACVSRNSVYRYHPSVLAALQQHRTQKLRAARPKAHTAPSTQIESAQHDMITKLGALVDHYYAAYREMRALLERRERELADLRRGMTAKVAPVRR